MLQTEVRAKPCQDLDEEFDRQVGNLLALGYAELSGRSEAELVALCEPLRDAARSAGPGSEDAALPFLLVVTSALVPTVAAVERWSIRGKPGWTDMADELVGYKPIDAVQIPAGPVYLLTDVRTGADTLNIPPAKAAEILAEQGRTPLTIDEGVALMSQLPGVLDHHNAFQALASRAPNKRIPSFWWSKGAARLGWCWLNNPHTWLGAASAAARMPRST